ncbi:MAG: site-2 protease family protein [Phycisphaerales bacterium JB059]
MNWWVHNLWSSEPALLVSWVVWVIGSIVLHELAHGWAAIRVGDRTPVETGHMTWNPLVHMGGFSLIVFAVVGIAWGMMPVNPSRMRGRHAEALVALAGPAMNLVLAVVAMALGLVWMGVGGGHWIPGVQADQPLYANMQIFFRAGVFLNVLLMVFNLMPIPPLDGSRVIAHYSPGYRAFFESENGRWVGMGLFVLLFFFGFDLIIGRVIGWTTDVWQMLAGMLGLT